MAVNKVFILGYLGQDPELKYTPVGKAVVSFSVATSERWTDDKGQKHEATEWHKLVAWGKTAELINTYLKKGDQAFFEGKNKTRDYEAKDGQKKYVTEVVVDNVQFLGSKGGGGKVPHPADSVPDDVAL